MPLLLSRMLVSVWTNATTRHVLSWPVNMLLIFLVFYFCSCILSYFFSKLMNFFKTIIQQITYCFSLIYDFPFFLNVILITHCRLFRIFWMYVSFTVMSLGNTCWYFCTHQHTLDSFPRWLSKKLSLGFQRRQATVTVTAAHTDTRVIMFPALAVGITVAISLASLGNSYRYYCTHGILLLLANNPKLKAL